MKKTLVMVLTLSVIVAIFAVAAPAYAAPDTGKGPGNGGNGGGNGNAGATGSNVLSAYMVDATAEVLGLLPADVAASFDAGETFYAIALANGFAEGDLAALLAEAKALATANAAADGLTIQAQMQLNTNMNTQSQLNDGICDGTGDCIQTDPINNLYAGTKSATKGRRGSKR